MKTKKILAAAAALCLCGSILTIPSAGAAIYGDHNGDGNVDAMDAALILQYAAYAGAGGTQTFYEFIGMSASNSDETLSIVCWTDADLNGMIEQYQSAYPGVNVQYVNVGSSGGEAREQYASYLSSIEDVDLYIVEPSWARQFMDDDTYSLPLSAIGITESDYTNAYDYTMALGTNRYGELRGATSIISPGCYCYRTDMAEAYLGITSPEEMQVCISDWDGFTDTAARLYSASGGTVTMSASVGGLAHADMNVPDRPWVTDGTLNTAMADDFLDLCLPLVRNGYVDPAIGQWTEEWMGELGSDGSTLGYFYASWCLPPGAMLEWTGGTAGNWAIVPGPEAFYWGGTMFCVAPQCNSAEEAERFLRYFTVEADSMEEYMRNYCEDSGALVNNRAAMSAYNTAAYQNPLLGGQQASVVLAGVAEIIELDAANISDYDGDLYWNLVDAIQDNPYGTKSDILEAFKAQVQEAYPEITVN